MLTKTVATATGLLTTVAIATLLASSATASSWVRVKTNKNNDVFSVDVASIEGQGRFRYFWSDVIFGRPVAESGRMAYRAVYYLRTDCQNKLYQLRFTQFLDQNNQTIKEYNYGDDFQLTAPRPGSSEEASLKFVCSRR